MEGVVTKGFSGRDKKVLNWGRAAEGEPGIGQRGPQWARGVAREVIDSLMLVMRMREE